MPDLMLLAVIAAIIIAVVIAFKILASLVKAVLTVSAILFVVSAVVGGIVLKDALDMKDHIQKQGSLQLLVDSSGTKILAGIISAPGIAEGEGAAELKVSALSGAEVDAINQQYSRKDYAAMLGSNYKLIIFNESALTKSLPQAINVSGSEISSELILEQLESGDAESRAAAFSMLLSLKASQDPLYVISGFREGGIMIYPETPSIRAIKVIPQSILDNVAGDAQPAGG